MSSLPILIFSYSRLPTDPDQAIISPPNCLDQLPNTVSNLFVFLYIEFLVIFARFDKRVPSMEGKRRRIWPYRWHTNKPTKVQSKLQRDDTMPHSRQTACGPVFFLALGELLLQLQDRMADSSNHAIAISPDCLFHDRSKHMQRCKCCWYSPRARAQNQRKQAC